MFGSGAPQKHQPPPTTSKTPSLTKIDDKEMSVFDNYDEGEAFLKDNESTNEQKEGRENQVIPWRRILFRLNIM